VLFDNHADHTFWIGTKISNVIMNLREPGQAISQRWRGVGTAHTSITPLPLAGVTRTKSRTEAKQALGLPASSTLLLSIASNYKYAPVAPDLDFPRVAIPLIRANPNTYLFVVGVTENHRWRNARKATANRLQTFAATPDIQTFLEAADIYLDSFPFGSLTSLLEAGQYGTPACGLTYGDHLCDALRAEDPALQTTLQRAPSPQLWRDAIQNLIDNPEHRETLGETTRTLINQQHTGSGWLASINRSYKQTLSTPRIGILAITEEPFATENLLLQALHHKGDQQRSWSSIVIRHLHLLPPKYRVLLSFHSFGFFLLAAKTVLKRRGSLSLVLKIIGN
jgi:hypothetical protein